MRPSAARTGDVHQSATDVAVANTGVVGGNFTINVSSVTETFWTEAFPLTVHRDLDPQRRGPSGLLATGSRVVPFFGRIDELARLTAWRDAPGDLSTMLVHAPGGQGKTRLAAAFAQRSAEDGWAVAQVRHNSDPGPPAPGIDQCTESCGLLVVVDYAERWPRVDLERLFQSRFLHQSGGPARVLLLSRPADYWWKSLANPLFKLNAGVDELPLGPLADTVAGRQIAFTMARDRFAQVLGATEFTELRPAGSLADQAYELVLTLHMAALVAVDAHLRSATAPTDPAELSSYLLDREYDHWHAMRDNGRISVSPTEMGRLVGLATLTRPLPTTVAADMVVVMGLADGPADALSLLGDHATCYPPTTAGTALEPLFPDRLGEDFLAQLLPGAGTGGHSDGWATTLPRQLLLPAGGDPPAAALAILVETGRRWQHVRQDHLFPLLHENPRLVVETGGASLVTLAEYATLELLERLDAHLPDRDRHVDLDTGMVALTRRLTEHGLTTACDDATRGALQLKLGIRASNAGLYGEAVTAERAAVAAYRRLATVDPAGYEPDLATALNNLSASLSELDRRREALPSIQEAVAIRRRLAEAIPVAYLPDLAAALNNLGNVHAHLGDHAEALDVTEQAVDTYRRLVKTKPAAYEPELARSLSNLGRDLARLGRFAEALVARQEAVTIRRRLAGANPTAHLPGLAASLHSLGRGFSELDRDDEAQAATREAVEIRRRLAAANPAAHQAPLADSLTSLGARLMRWARHQEALAIMREAVDVRRQLAELDPIVHRRGLGTSLHSLSICLKESERAEEALIVAREAVEIRRKLAATTPAAHEPNLAQSLYSLAVCLRRVGDKEHALVVSLEAAELSRKLAESGLAMFAALHARALRHAGICLSRLERCAEAVTYQQEAIAIWRRLVAAHPAKYEPTFAKSLLHLSYDLTKLNEPEQALSTVREAVEIAQRLAAADPSRREPHLASALMSLGDCLSTTGRAAEALPHQRAAVELFRRLAAADPGTHEDDLAMSLRSLSVGLGELGHDEEALGVGQETVTITLRLARRDPARYGPALGRSWTNLAVFQRRLCRHANALTAAREAVAIWRRQADADPALADALRLMAKSLERTGELEKAVTAAQEAVEIQRRLGDTDNLRRALETKASILDQLGRHDDADQVRQEANNVR
ncbi:MAG TPA: tetratricopeptide repeat protein [Pseudonocardiaceae bacterium]|nr:tetratricopeptide repeat protein [Pseudonocardiaceae bacterium]